MARSRNIKPGFFTNEDLVELEFSTRLLFAGLWTVADKAGRLQDRPKKIKIDVFPADNIDVDPMLQELHCSGFILRYVLDDKKYIQIKNWAKHQNPHHTEKASEIPAPNGGLTVKEPFESKHSPKQDGGNLADSLLLIPEGRKQVRVSAMPKPHFDLPDWINRVHWDIWHSGKSRKNASIAQKQLAVDKLTRWRDSGIDHAKALENAAEGGWQGLHEPKPDSVKPYASTEPVWRREQRERTEKAVPGIAAKSPFEKQSIEVEVHDVTAIGLG